MRDRIVIGLLLCLALLATIAFMTVNLRGNIAFALELRGIRLAALVTVAVAIALSTVTFQTITGNRILTPSIMGLDALYQFGQAALALLREAGWHDAFALDQARMSRRFKGGVLKE